MLVLRDNVYILLRGKSQAVRLDTLDGMMQTGYVSVHNYACAYTFNMHGSLRIVHNMHFFSPNPALPQCTWFGTGVHTCMGI